MTSSAPSILSGFFADALACTRCGSQNVFPSPGPFAALGVVVGLARHNCRPCGRPFWTKASAEYTWSEEAEPEALLEEELLEAPTAPADAEPVDLTALDAEFARRCAAEKPRRHRRRKRQRAREQKTPALARSS